MNKIVARCIFIVAVGMWVVLSVVAPWVLCDKNTFLKNFVNNELLNVLGVFVAITLASTANLHLEFNNIEYAVRKTFLTKTRAAVKSSALSMIVLFALALMVVVVKPLIDSSSDIAISFMNGLALLIVLFNLSVLTDLTLLVFKIEPLHKVLGEDESGKP